MLKKWQPSNSVTNRRINRLTDVFNTPSPTLTKVSELNGPQYTEGIIMGYLVWLNEEVLNLSQPMTEIQIEYTAQMIIDKYYYFKFPDIVLIMKMIIGGDFGEFYGSLDPNKILKYFNEYSMQRQQSARQHKKTQQKIEYENKQVENYIKQNATKINKL